MSKQRLLGLMLLATLLVSNALDAATKSPMSIEFMLGQKQMLDIRYFCDDGTPTKRCKKPVTTVPTELKNLIVEHQIGGIILFADNLQDKQQILALTKELQAVAANANLPPLFIAIDQEGGRVSRFPLGVGNAFAGNMAIGATYKLHNKRFATEVKQAIGKQILALGFNVNFAPTVDVNVNPENPVINVRSYGESAIMVAELGMAAVAAMQSSGVITAMKHFPGHGDTHVDSHTGLPLVEHSKSQIEAIDLLPFSRAISAGGLFTPEMIMTAHIQYPNLDATEFLALDGRKTILPATLSRTILTDVLRDDLKFDGLIVTDAMDMAGIANYMDQADAVLQTFYAGADIALMPYTVRNHDDIEKYRHMMARVKAAVITSRSEGRASVPKRDQLMMSTARILETKKHYLQNPSQHELVSNNELELELARAAITPVLGDAKIQLDKNHSIGLVMPDNARCEAMKWALQQQAFERLSCLSLATLATEEQLAQFVNDIDVLIVSDITPQHSLVEMGGMDDFENWQDRADKTQQYAQISRLLTFATAQSKQRIFIALRAPYVIEKFSGLIDNAIVTYDYRVSVDDRGQARGVMFDVVAEWLAGAISARGQLPVSVNLNSDTE